MSNLLNNNNRYLLMWLEAPLQSWGVDSKFDRRYTIKFPTKSAILGLLCNARGAGGEQCEFLESMASLTQTVIAFIKDSGKKSLDEYGNQGLQSEIWLCDFHMVGSGYNEEDPWQNFLIPKRSDGKKGVGVGTKLTYRYYLQDATFAVILEVPIDISNDLVNALENPVWDLYLGRKSCAPTDFICRGLFDTEAEAIAHGIDVAKGKGLTEKFRVLDGRIEGDEEIILEEIILNDVPLRFGQNKKYGNRFVTIVNKK